MLAGLLRRVRHPCAVVPFLVTSAVPSHRRRTDNVAGCLLLALFIAWQVVATAMTVPTSLLFAPASQPPFTARKIVRQFDAKPQLAIDWWTTHEFCAELERPGGGHAFLMTPPDASAAAPSSPVSATTSCACCALTLTSVTSFMHSAFTAS